MTNWRLAIDIGGTFTDLALLGGDGTLRAGKSLTDKHDPAGGVMAAVDEFLAAEHVSLTEVADVLHATTLATNTVLERSGPSVGVVTTRGFRDILEIQRQKRYELYDFSAAKPTPIVNRSNIREVTERLDAAGCVVVPLDDGDAVAAIDDLVKVRGVAAVAVCLLHSYANPEHERQIREHVNQRYPDVPVSISSEVAPLIREYERFTTTAVDAYVTLPVAGYIRRLEAALHGRGFRGRFLIMHSAGGLVNTETALAVPVRLIESGPAAGVIGAVGIAHETKKDRVLAFDMGGTTAKISMIENGIPERTTELEVDKVLLKPRSGLPLLIPSIELGEIGAGGGSIARLSFGLISVGPESAGADPGPICYGRGGTEPTVTDANVVLGYLNPDYFLGGRMTLDVSAARRGILSAIAGPLDVQLEEAAWGVHEIVTTNMAQAARIVSVEKGRDPRSMCLVAFGGAGPLHAARLARAIGIREVVCPPHAGVGSAIGLLVAPVQFDVSQTLLTRVDDGIKADDAFAALEHQARSSVGRVGDASTGVSRWVQMRFVGQGYEIQVPISAEGEGRITSSYLRQSFRRTYQRVYGYVPDEGAIEIVAWHLRITTDPATAAPAQTPPTATDPLKGTRQAYFPDAGGMQPTAIYDRYLMSAGYLAEGPSIIEEAMCSIVVPPGDVATVDEFGAIRISVNHSGDGEAAW